VACGHPSSDVISATLSLSLPHAKRSRNENPKPRLENLFIAICPISICVCYHGQNLLCLSASYLFRIVVPSISRFRLHCSDRLSDDLIALCDTVKLHNANIAPYTVFPIWRCTDKALSSKSTLPAPSSAIFSDLRALSTVRSISTSADIHAFAANPRGSDRLTSCPQPSENPSMRQLRAAWHSKQTIHPPPS
jgi:hypothetical protein